MSNKRYLDYSGLQELVLKIKESGGQQIQVTELPIPTLEIKGTIYQYIGSDYYDDEVKINYMKGCFYLCDEVEKTIQITTLNQLRNIISSSQKTIHATIFDEQGDVEFEGDVNFIKYRGYAFYIYNDDVLYSSISYEAGNPYTTHYWEDGVFETDEQVQEAKIKMDIKVSAWVPILVSQKEIEIVSQLPVPSKEYEDRVVFLLEQDSGDEPGPGPGPGPGPK